jgi:hypothetical protein
MDVWQEDGAVIKVTRWESHSGRRRRQPALCQILGCPFQRNECHQAQRDRLFSRPTAMEITSLD